MAKPKYHTSLTPWFLRSIFWSTVPDAFISLQSKSDYASRSLPLDKGIASGYPSNSGLSLLNGCPCQGTLWPLLGCGIGCSRKQTIQPRSYTGLWTTTAGFVATTGYLLWHNTSPVYAEASSYAGTVEGKIEPSHIANPFLSPNRLLLEPNTKLAFPIYLKTDSEWKRLIGLGVRQVSFLNINVYVLGLYMRSQDINNLKTMEGWEVNCGHRQTSSHKSFTHITRSVSISQRFLSAKAWLCHSLINLWMWAFA